jgi:hypothetical protein
MPVRFHKLNAQGERLPGWVTEAFVVGVETRLRGLIGHYRATPCGQTMELRSRLDDLQKNR